MQPASSTVAARLSLIASAETLEQLDMHIDALTDPDARSAAIRADHPELDQALRDGREEVLMDGKPVSVRLHLAMHEIVANQLADNDPGEVFETAGRLRDAGYDRHEIMHMLAAPLTEQIFGALTHQTTYDREKHVAELRTLPGSWERRRQQRTVARTNPQGRHANRRRRSRR